MTMQLAHASQARPGRGSPLFLISHDASAPLDEHLFRDIDCECPAYQIALQVNHGLRTLQAMAVHLLCSLREIQPSGPYRILGWGLGGLLAYEIGIQILGMDEEIGFIGALSQTGVYAPALTYQVQPASFQLHVVAQTSPVAHAPSPWYSLLPASQIRLVERGDLANAVSRQKHARSSRHKAAHSSLVTIQIERRATQMVFCVPGAGATVMDFIPLGEALGKDYTLLGFQPRGMDSGVIPHTCVEAAAQAYLAELERMAPAATKVHLVGHSFGGWVALELSLLLQRAEQPVESLTIVDSESPAVEGPPAADCTRVEALMAFISNYEQRIEKPIGIAPADFQHRDAEAQLDLLHGTLVRINAIPAAARKDMLRGPIRCFESAMRTCYRPRGVFNGAAMLVLAREDGEPAQSAEQRAAQLTAHWRRFVPRMACRLESGNHISVLKSPNIAALVRMKEGHGAAKPVARVSGHDAAKALR